MPVLGPETEALVAAHWSQATADAPLFNGRVFCAETITPTRLEGHWTEYRRITAQIRDPTLFQTLQVRSLAVCGILSCPEGIAIGRREPHSAYQPGLWQLSPAGSVDHGAATPAGADWCQALLTELHEELGIPPTHVTAMRPLCLVQHPTGVLDMGIHIATTLRAAEILHHHHTAGNAEYDELLILPPEVIPDAIAARGGTLAPSTPRFLAALNPGHPISLS